MKTYTCACGNRLYFENTSCVVCGRLLGFITENLQLSPLEPVSDDTWRALSAPQPNMTYKQCTNYRTHRVCNWMIPADDQHQFCTSCRLNKIIPNLSKDENHQLWMRVETAKRRLLYSLYSLKLPVIGRVDDPNRGLGFRFLEDPARPNWQQQVENKKKIFTGHVSGLITINIAEADPSERESIREKMNETYRTLLGHFRHESGHYYWEMLINGSSWLDEFRVLFGDEQTDYSQAMSLHYNNNNTANWQQNYITEYASSHPWEDWAETWAHYLHIFDTLQTANDMQLTIGGSPVNELDDIDAGLARWLDLATVLNALNRSMGISDPYPFVINDAVINKLRFIHRVIAGTSIPLL